MRQTEPGKIYGLIADDHDSPAQASGSAPAEALCCTEVTTTQDHCCT